MQRLLLTSSVLAALAGCATPPRDVINDPSVERLTLTSPHSVAETYERAYMAAINCDPKGVNGSTRASEAILVSALENGDTVYVMQFTPSGSGTRVVVSMPLYSSKQRTTWPDLFDDWMVRPELRRCARDYR